MSEHQIVINLNGEPVKGVVEARRSLADFLRVDAGRTGTHLGCEHGVCGACTVIVNGDAVRSCLMLAVQANGASVTTIEGLATPDGKLHPVQQALQDEHGLQCGFCTPGVVMTLVALKRQNPAVSEEELRDAVTGNLCRCTGYQGIMRAIGRIAAAKEGDGA